MNETRFALIEHNTKYKCTWNTEELNQNDYNETGEIKFFIENWLFETHPVTRVARWVRRRDLPRRAQRLWFQVLGSVTENGTFTFKQTTRLSARIQFDISIIVVKKQTENLKILYTSTLLSFVPDISRFRGREAIIAYCRLWYHMSNKIVKPESCPCTLESAKMDRNLTAGFTCSTTEPDCYENVNAHQCFLKKLDNRYVHMYVNV